MDVAPAAMAVAPDFRGRGLGKNVMKVVLEEAVLRKDRTMILEVFEQNPAAVSLYTGLGFRTVGRLLGYDFNPQGAGLRASDAEPLHEIDPLMVARLIVTEGEPDLPWMLMLRPWRQRRIRFRLFISTKLALRSLPIPTLKRSYSVAFLLGRRIGGKAGDLEF
jgi:hypothetical protein